MVNGTCDFPKRSHRPADFLYWNLMLSVPFLSACIAAAKSSPAVLAGYLVAAAGAGLLLYRFFCTRCPHYGGEDGKTRCLFLWRIPAFFRSRRGPYTAVDLAVSAAAAAVLILVPATWLHEHPSLAVVYGLSTAAVVATLYRNECSRCIHRGCPANRTGTGTDMSKRPHTAD
jgi:hypothetical protein